MGAPGLAGEPPQRQPRPDAGGGAAGPWAPAGRAAANPPATQPPPMAGAAAAASLCRRSACPWAWLRRTAGPRSRRPATHPQPRRPGRSRRSRAAPWPAAHALHEAGWRPGAWRPPPLRLHCRRLRRRAVRAAGTLACALLGAQSCPWQTRGTAALRPRPEPLHATGAPLARTAAAARCRPAAARPLRLQSRPPRAAAPTRPGWGLGPPQLAAELPLRLRPRRAAPAAPSLSRRAGRERLPARLPRSHPPPLQLAGQAGPGRGPCALWRRTAARLPLARLGLPRPARPAPCGRAPAARRALRRPRRTRRAGAGSAPGAPRAAAAAACRPPCKAGSKHSAEAPQHYAGPVLVIVRQHA